MRTQRQRLFSRVHGLIYVQDLFPCFILKRTSKQAERQRTAKSWGGSHSFMWQADFISKHRKQSSLLAVLECGSPASWIKISLSHLPLLSPRFWTSEGAQWALNLRPLPGLLTKTKQAFMYKLQIVAKEGKWRDYSNCKCSCGEQFCYLWQLAGVLICRVFAVVKEEV